ncbi:hypothetical protein BV898_15448 [Hypsibius exemplaris]|uniref:Secreted protein n=1 Tax=Hypsibius exemplaris TaxID=2072580 RepID=A0A9X6RKH7_HYPEX|nr:hypothetical protein BV898_15448 [Hypsibius exemplaris]
MLSRQILALLLCLSVVVMVSATAPATCDCKACPTGTDAETIRRQKSVNVIRARINQNIQRRTIGMGPDDGCTLCPVCGPNDTRM